MAPDQLPYISTRRVFALSPGKTLDEHFRRARMLPHCLHGSRFCGDMPLSIPKTRHFLSSFSEQFVLALRWWMNLKDPKGLWKPLGLAAFFLGIATSIRVLGPLAGVLVGIYALSQLKKSQYLY